MYILVVAKATVGRLLVCLPIPDAREQRASEECNESSENIFICCKPTDKNTNIKNYKWNQEGHPTQQSPSPGSLDAVLSCWETGPQFSYYGCNLGAFDPTPCQRGSLTIPDREHDLIVHQQCYAPRIHNKVLTPDPLNIPQVQMREAEDLEKVTDKLVTGVPAGSLLFSM
ncbi:hypothetical protein F5879DRAFT_920966 [Lentinula edodes]|nr:hypothetical protein F5879DRAFT_920966 [Lentinula edodes]